MKYISIVLWVICSLGLKAGNAQGVEIPPDKDRILFLIPTTNGPHDARATAKDTDVDVILLKVRFITNSRIDKTSLFYKRHKGLFLSAVSAPPTLLCYSSTYYLGKVYFREQVDGAWSEEKSITLGAAHASIALPAKVKAVKITRIQYK